MRLAIKKVNHHRAFFQLREYVVYYHLEGKWRAVHYSMDYREARAQYRMLRFSTDDYLITIANHYWSAEAEPVMDNYAKSIRTVGLDFKP